MQTLKIATDVVEEHGKKGELNKLKKEEVEKRNNISQQFMQGQIRKRLKIKVMGLIMRKRMILWSKTTVVKRNPKSASIVNAHLRLHRENLLQFVLQ